MRRRLGVTQTEVAARMGITQGRVSAIEHAKPGTTELQTLVAYVEASRLHRTWHRGSLITEVEGLGSLSA